MKGIDRDRAKAIGRMLFQKYDLGKRGALGPKQCYEVFSDFCYRILSINPQPTMEQANSMFEVLDQNKDKRVTQADFQSLAVRYLCQSSFSASNFGQSNALRGSQASSTSYYSNYSSTKHLQPQTSLQTSNVVERHSTLTTNRPLTLIARKRIDVARRLFKMFDKDGNGSLTEEEIPFIMTETYREMGQTYNPTKEDVKSYMKMVDSNGDGKVSLAEFEEIILRSLKNAGFEIYQ